MQFNWKPTKPLSFWVGIVLILLAYSCYSITYSIKPFSRTEGFVIKVVFFAVIYYTGKFHIGPINAAIYWLAKSWKYIYLTGAIVSLSGTLIRYYVKSLPESWFNFFVTVDMFLFSPVVYVIFAVLKIKILERTAAPTIDESNP